MRISALMNTLDRAQRRPRKASHNAQRTPGKSPVAKGRLTILQKALVWHCVTASSSRQDEYLLDSVGWGRDPSTVRQQTEIVSLTITMSPEYHRVSVCFLSLIESPLTKSQCSHSFFLITFLRRFLSILSDTLAQELPLRMQGMHNALPCNMAHFCNLNPTR